MSAAAPTISLPDFISSAFELAPSAGRGRPSSVGHVSISTDICNRQNETFGTRISISKDVIKQLRWMPGDRLDLMVNCTRRQILIRRIPAGGWALCDINSKSKKRAKMYAKFPYVEGHPSVQTTTDCPNYWVTDDGLLIEVPGSAAWSKNLRSCA